MGVFSSLSKVTGNNTAQKDRLTTAVQASAPAQTVKASAPAQTVQTPARQSSGGMFSRINSYFASGKQASNQGSMFNHKSAEISPELQQTTRGTLAKIQQMKSFDPNQAQSAMDMFKQLRYDPSSRYYNPYTQSTNRAINYMRELGMEVPDAPDDKWFEQNAWLKQYYVPTANTNSLSSTMTNKRASKESKLAYYYNQLEMAREDTAKAKAERERLNNYLTYWATQPDRDRSDEEIISQIDWKQYPTIAKMRETAARGTPMELNEAIDVSDDAMYAALWAARNGGSTGNVYQDMINSVTGVGNQYQRNEEVRRRLDYTSEDYAPYSVGSTMDKERQLFGVSGFDEDWINANKNIMVTGTEEEQKGYQAVLEAYDFTQEADKELESLMTRLDKKLASEKNPEAVKKYFDSLLESGSYSSLVKMDKSMRKGNTGLLNTTHEIEYSHGLIEKYIDAECAKHQDDQDDIDFAANIATNVSEPARVTPTTQEPELIADALGPNDTRYMPEGALVADLSGRTQAAGSPATVSPTSGVNIDAAASTAARDVNLDNPPEQPDQIAGKSALPPPAAPMTEAQVEVTRQQESTLKDGIEMAEDTLTPSEQGYLETSGSMAFDYIKDTFAGIKNAWNTYAPGLLSENEKQVRQAHTTAILDSAQRMYDYDQNAENLAALKYRAGELEKIAGGKEYVGQEVQTYVNRTVSIGKTPYNVTLGLQNGEYVLQTIDGFDKYGDPYGVSDPAEWDALANSKEINDLILDANNTAAKITEQNQQYSELTDEEKNAIQAYKSVMLQIQDAEAWQTEHQAEYEEAQARFKADQKAYRESLYVNSKLGQDTTMLEQAEAAAAYITQFHDYEATVWSRYNPSDFYAEALRAPGADREAVLAAAKQGNDELLQELELARTVRDYYKDSGLNIPQEYLSNLDRHIAKLERDNQDYQYFSLCQNKDFDEIAQKGREIEYESRPQTQVMFGLIRNERNDWDINQYYAYQENGVYDEAGQFDDHGLKGLLGGLNSLMSENELDTYYYLLGSGREKEAQQYAAYMADPTYGVLWTRQREKTEKAAQDLVDSGAGGFLAGNALAVIMSPVSSIAAAGNYAYSLISGNELSPDSPLMTFSHFRNATREESAQEIQQFCEEHGYGKDSWQQKVMQAGYEIVINRADSAANALFTGGLFAGDGSGFFQEAGREFLGALPMGVSASMDAAAEAKSKGASDAQAYGVACVTLFAETLTEAISLDNMRDAFKAGEEISTGTIKEFLKNWVLRAGPSEALGESLNDIIENFADEKIMGALSDHADRVWEYRMKGMSKDDAEAAARRDEMNNVLRTALISYISPGLDIVQTGAGRLEYYRQVTEEHQKAGDNRSMLQIMKGERKANRALESAGIINDGSVLVEDAVSSYGILESAKNGSASAKTAAVSTVLAGAKTGLAARSIADAASGRLTQILGTNNAPERVQSLIIGAAKEGINVQQVAQGLQNAALSEHSAAAEVLKSDAFQLATPDRQAAMIADTVQADATNEAVTADILKSVHEYKVNKHTKNLIADGGLEAAKPAVDAAKKASRNARAAETLHEERQEARKAAQDALAAADGEVQRDPKAGAPIMAAALDQLKSAKAVEAEYAQKEETSRQLEEEAKGKANDAVGKAMKDIRQQAETMATEEEAQEAQADAEAAATEQEQLVADAQRQADQAMTENAEAADVEDFIARNNPDATEEEKQHIREMFARIRPAMAEEQMQGLTPEQQAAADQDRRTAERSKFLNQVATRFGLKGIIEVDPANETDEGRRALADRLIGGNGYYNPETNQIVLNRNATTEDALYFVLGHELTHVTEKAGEYSSLADAILQLTFGEGVTYQGILNDMKAGRTNSPLARMVNDRRAQYEKATGQSYGDDYYLQEIVADNFGSLLRWDSENPEAQQGLVNRLVQENPSTARKIFESLKSFLKKMVGAKGAWQTDMQRTVDMFAQALDNAQAVRQGNQARPQVTDIRSAIESAGLSIKTGTSRIYEDYSDVDYVYDSDGNELGQLYGNAIKGAKDNKTLLNLGFTEKAYTTKESLYTYNADQGTTKHLLDRQGNETAAEELQGGTAVIDTEKLSLNSFNEAEQARTRAALLAAKDSQGRRLYTSEQVDKYMSDALGIASIIAGDRARLDFVATDNPLMTFLKKNQDYGFTLDASTLCAKRLLYQGTFNYVQHAMPDEVFTPEDLVDLVNIMNEMGYETPCGICYVESRRRWLDTYANEFIDRITNDPEAFVEKVFKKAPDEEKAALRERLAGEKPSIEDLTTTDGLEALRKNDPQMYKAFVAAMNAKGSANPKIVQPRAEYKGEIAKLTKKQIQALKDIGGLRVQSFSDFETPHLLDMMQAVMDMAARRLTSQAYTKVPNFAWVFGDTGIKINLSLIGKGTGLDDNGNLIFDNKEGINFDEAMRLRDRYSKNVGTIIVGINDDHIVAAMGDPRIDFIIPFHKSGWSDLERKGIKSLQYYEDYTDTQNERKLFKDENGKVIRNKDGSYKTVPAKESKIVNFEPVGAHAYWDFSKNGEWNARKYLKMCAEDGRIPKFNQFLVDNGDGSFSLPEGDDKRSKAIREGYWKTLIDFKMYDNDGNGAAQQEVTPNINMDQAQRVLNEYSLRRPSGNADTKMVDMKSNNDVPVATTAGDEFIRRIREKRAGKNPTPPNKPLEATPEIDVTKLGRSQFADEAPVGATNGTAAMASGAEAELGNTPSEYQEAPMQNQQRMAIDPETGETIRRSLGDIDEDVQEAAEKAFVNSKARTSDGKLMPVYHGTKADFNVFDTSVSGGSNGAAEGFGIYLTDNPEVSEAYGDRQISAYVNMERPARSDKKTIKKSELVKLIKAACEKEAQNFVDEGSYGSVSEALPDTWISNYVYTPDYRTIQDAYKAVADSILSMNDNDMDIVQEIMAGMGIRDYGRAMDFYHEVLTPTTGIDGFWTTWKDAQTGATSNVMLAFDSSQIKSNENVTYDDQGNPIPLGERFNTSNPDIRYSLPTDAPYMAAVERGEMDRAQEEVKAAAEQAMQNSKVRDEEGRLLTVYHGTTEDFTVFDMSKGRSTMDIQGAFFSPYDIEASGYGDKVGSYYLNITNPAPEGIAYATLNKYKGQNEAGMKAREDLISMGYDGVENYDEYIAFYPEQIKSADPVTYDDQGNVIPLSERFKQTNNDIRYQLPDDSVLERQIREYLRNGGSLSRNPGPSLSQASIPKQRQFGSQTAQESEALHEKVKEYLRNNSGYDPESNKEQLDRAISWVRSQANENDPDGYRAAVEAVTSDSFDYRSADGQAQMLNVMGMAALKNDTDTEMRLADAYNRQGTDLGRALQARKIFRLMTPIGRKAYFQKQVDELNRDIGKKTGKTGTISIDPWLLEAAGAAQNEEDFQKVRKAVAKRIGEQIPANWKDKLRSWRMLAMLGNPRTHIRNVIGNAMFIPAVSIKNKMGAVMEGALSKKFEQPVLKANEIFANDGKAHVSFKLTAFNGDEAIGNQEVASIRFSSAPSIEVADMLGEAGWKQRGGKWIPPTTHITANATTELIQKGNAVFMAENGISTTKKFERTKTLTPVLSKEIRNFARQDAIAMRDALTGEAKYNEEDLIDRERRHFKGVLQALSDFNSNALEREDWFFLKGHYRRAFGGWIQANGYTVEQLRNDPALLEKGRAYAIQEAQKATYRDFNGLAKKLNDLTRNPETTGQKALAFGVEAVLPFKKTPANVLKRGIEYSPIGIARALTTDLYHLKQYNNYQKGNLDTLPSTAITPNQFIDNLCSGLTGTAIMAMGAILGNMGVVSCGLDDDDDEFEKLKGNQAYSIKFSIGGEDYTFTMDWAAPMCMPFFVGAAIQEQFANEGGAEQDINNIVNAFGNITEPVFNLSMLDGVNSLIDMFVAGDDTNATLTQLGAKVVSNYASSYIPSALGAATRAFFDDTRRKAFVESGKGSGILGTFRYAREQFENKIPGLSQTNIPYRDVWGNPEKSGLLERILENFVLPGYINQYKDDPIVNELAQVGRVPKEPPKTFTANNTKYVLTDKQWDAYKTARGQTAYNQLGKLMNTPEYQSASLEERGALIDGIWDYANKVGKETVFPELRDEEAEPESNPVQSILDKQEKKKSDTRVKMNKANMLTSLDSNDIEGFNAMVEALQEDGVTDEKMRDYIRDQYRDAYKAAYRANDEIKMDEIEEKIKNAGFEDLDKKNNILDQWAKQAEKTPAVTRSMPGLWDGTTDDEFEQQDKKRNDFIVELNSRREEGKLAEMPIEELFDQVDEMSNGHPWTLFTNWVGDYVDTVDPDLEGSVEDLVEYLEDNGHTLENILIKRPEPYDTDAVQSSPADYINHLMDLDEEGSLSMVSMSDFFDTINTMTGDRPWTVLSDDVGAYVDFVDPSLRTSVAEMLDYLYQNGKTEDDILKKLKKRTAPLRSRQKRVVENGKGVQKTQKYQDGAEEMIESLNYLEQVANGTNLTNSPDDSSSAEPIPGTFNGDLSSVESYDSSWLPYYEYESQTPIWDEDAPEEAKKGL